MKPQMSHEQKQIRDYFTITFASMKRHQKRRKQGDLPFTKEDFINWFWSQNNSNYLFKNWAEYGCAKNLKPSIDREDLSKGYEFSNMRIMTHRENHHRQSLMRGAFVQQVDEDGNVVAIFPSMNQATQTLKLSRSAIPRAVKTGGKAGGYYWRKLP